MEISIELVLLFVSILFFISLLVSKAGYRFGVPALLLFLGVGMLFGTDGLGVEFESYTITQTVGTIALCVILFSGGMDTKVNEIKPVLYQGGILATVGVFATALLSAVVIWWVMGMSFVSAGMGFLTSLLLASTLSSTDSASVFSIIRSKGLNLKNNLRPMLELESGSNDPMAYILTITLTQILVTQNSVNYIGVGLTVLMQLAIGAVAGYAFGKAAVWVINRIRLNNSSLYPILLLTVCLFIFSAVFFLNGNAYLAVYIGGLIIGNSHFAHRRNSMNFFDGLAWLCQLAMFLTLGLLVNPHELVPYIIPGLIISFAMIFLVRPICVFLCLTPFTKMGIKDKTFVSWVGLRGAVPIIFAIIPLSQGVPQAEIIFNIVFVCTLISLILQGTTLSYVAKWLGLSEKPRDIKKPVSFDIEFPDEIKSALTEVNVSAEMLEFGHNLKNIPMPDKTLVMMVKRGDKFFVPRGDTELHEKDKLLIVTDDQEIFIQHQQKAEDKTILPPNDAL